jgi:hypothetical protein
MSNGKSFRGCQGEHLEEKIKTVVRSDMFSDLQHFKLSPFFALLS